MSERGRRDLKGAVAAKPSLKDQVDHGFGLGPSSVHIPLLRPFQKIPFTKPVSEFEWGGKLLPALHY